MSDNKGSDQGVHYHYHFYGYGQPGPNGADASAQGGQQAGYGQNGEGSETAQGGFSGQQPPFPGTGFPGAGMAPPPGFPFPPGAQQAGAAAGGTANGNANAGTSGLNWHLHPNADSLVKGLAVGAGAAYLLTNENAQRTIMRTAVQVWAFLQNGLEEMKERLHDAEAEVAAAAAQGGPEPEAYAPEASAEEAEPSTTSTGS